MRTRRALVFIMAAQAWCGGLSQAQSPKMTGSWKVDIAFANGESRSLRFEAHDSGKGSFRLVDPNNWDPGKPAEVKWAQGKDKTVTFSGPMEFPLGNVGRDAGTLEFKGKFEGETWIKGEVTFSPVAGNGPSKAGTFSANRIAGDKSP